MTIKYAISDLNPSIQDVQAWANKNLPQLLACGFLKLGTDQELAFVNENADDINISNFIELESSVILEMESIIKAIQTFDLHTKGKLKKYNTSKKVFIVDLLHRIGEDLDVGETIESLTILSCTLKEDNTFDVDPDSLNTTVVSCYDGEDVWGDRIWNKVSSQKAFSSLEEQVNCVSEYKDLDVGSFAIKFIDNCYKAAIKDNLSKVIKQAESVALIN